MKISGNTYTRRYIFTVLMAVSVLAGFIFFATNNLDFIIAAIDSGKFHLPNIAYSMARIVSGLLLPFIFIVPSMFEFGRIKIAKVLLVLYGVLQALTLTWVFYFLGSNSFGDLFSNQKIIEFQSLPANSFISSYVYWDTYSWWGFIFTALYSALCIYTGISFDDNRLRVRTCVSAIVIARVILPIINNLIFGQSFLSAFWLTNNYADMLSLVAFAAAIFLASDNDTAWIELVWDQAIIGNNDDDDLLYDMQEFEN